MQGNAGHIPQTYAELSPAQRWRFKKHSGPFMLSMAWGAFCGLLLGWLFGGFVLITDWSAAFSNSTMGVALVVLLMVGHVVVCIGSPILAYRVYRSAEARLAAEFLAAEAELPESR